MEPSIDAGVTPLQWLTIYGGYDVTYRSPALGGGGGMFQSVDPAFYTLAKGAYSQVGVKVHFNNAPVLKNFILGVNYFHLDYTNQEIDFETASGLEESGGGNSTYHGVDAFFDDDPVRNLHIFFNFAGEASNFTNYIAGGPSLAECAAQESQLYGVQQHPRFLRSQCHPQCRILLWNRAQRTCADRASLLDPAYRLAIPLVEPEYQ